MKEKIRIFLLAFLFVFSVMPVTTARAADDIVANISTSNGAVEKGQVFNITINITNNHKSSIDNISATIDVSSGFRAIGSGDTITYKNGNNTKIDSGKSGPITFALSYYGESGSTISIPVIVSYKLEGIPDTISKTFYKDIRIVKDSGDDSSSPIVTPPDTSKYIPVLTVMNDSMPTGWAGGTLTIPLNIKNTSQYSAKDISITPELENDSPFTIDNINLAQHVDDIYSGKNKVVTFKFNVAPDAQAKTYSLKFNIKYYNYYGNFFNNTTTTGGPEVIYVKILNSSTLPKLNIANIELGAPSVQPQQNIDIKLNLSNLGSMDAKDIKVSLVGLKEDGFGLYNDTSVKIINYIYGWGNAKVNYTVTPSKKMETGNYSLTAKVDYKDMNGKDYSIEQQFFIPVENGTTGKTVPKIILSQYKCDPTIAKAGKNFKLNLTFKNTSKEKPVQNIKIFFTVPDGGTSGSVFTPVNGSNTFYIDNIPPMGTSKKSIDFFTIPDASPKTYTLTANFEYEDDKGTEYKATDIIGIPVSQQISLDTSDIDIPQEVFAGQPMPVGFDLYNTGKVQLRNMMIKLEGDFNMQNGRYFIGNFDAGASDHYEGTVIPNAPGEVKGAVVLSYDEPTGEHREIKKEFTLNVTQMPAPVQGKDGMPEGMNPKQPKKGILSNKTILWIGIGAAVVVAAVVVFLVIRKKRKAGITLDE